MANPIISAVSWLSTGSNTGTLTFTVNPNGAPFVAVVLAGITPNVQAVSPQPIVVNSYPGNPGLTHDNEIFHKVISSLTVFSVDLINLPNALPCLPNKPVTIKADQSTNSGTVTGPGTAISNFNIPLNSGPLYVPTGWNTFPPFVLNAATGVYGTAVVPSPLNPLPRDPTTYRIEWGITPGGPYPNIIEKSWSGDSTVPTCASISAMTASATYCSPTDFAPNSSSLPTSGGYSGSNGGGNLAFTPPCNTTIYFRATGYRSNACVANGLTTNLSGPLIYSPELSFTTPAPVATATAPAITWAQSGGFQQPTIISTIHAAQYAADFRLEYNYGPVATYSTLTPIVNRTGGSAPLLKTWNQLSGLSSGVPGTTLHARVAILKCDGTTAYATLPSTTVPAINPTITGLGVTIVGGPTTFNITASGNANANGCTASSTVNFYLALVGNAYGAPFSSQVGPTGLGAIAFNASSLGLLAGTAYKVKMEVTGGCGSTSDEVTFTTPNLPACTLPFITTGPTVTSPTANTANFAATIDPNGYAGTAEYKWGNVSGGPYPFTTGFLGYGAGPPVGVPAAIGALTAGTTYYYTLCLTSTCDNIEHCFGEYSWTQPAIPPPAPTITPNGAGPAGAPDCGMVTGTTTIGFLDSLINPNGLFTTAYIEYGINTFYGSTTAPTGIGAGIVDVPFSDVITGLNPGTTYHFRFVATNASGTNTSVDFSCTTMALPPPAPTINDSLTSCFDATDTTMTINTAVNPNGLVTTGYIEYGTFPGGPYPFSSAVQPQGAGIVDFNDVFIIGGLLPGTAYYWRFVATNASGTNRSIQRICLTDSVVPPPAPGIIQIPGCSATTVNSITVDASVDPQGFSTDVFVEYGFTPALGFGTVGPLNVGAGVGYVPASIVVPGLPAGTIVYFRVRATNINGSNYTSVDSCVTLDTPTAPTPSCSPAWSIGSTQAIVAGGVLPNGLDTFVTFEIDEDPLFGSPIVTAPIFVSGLSAFESVSAIVGGLTPSTLYHFRVVAVSAGGTADSATCDFTTAADLNISDPSTDPSCAEIATVELCHSQAPVVLCEASTGRLIKVHTIYDRQGNPIPAGTIDAYGNPIGTLYTDGDDNPLDPLTVGALVACTGAGDIVPCISSLGFTCVKTTSEILPSCPVAVPTLTGIAPVPGGVSLALDFGVGCTIHATNFAALLLGGCEAVGFGPTGGPTSFEILTSACTNIVDLGTGVVTFDWDFNLNDPICSPVLPNDPITVCCGGGGNVLVTFNAFNQIAIQASNPANLGLPIALGGGDVVSCIDWSAQEQFLTQNSQLVTLCDPIPPNGDVVNCDTTIVVGCNLQRSLGQRCLVANDWQTFTDNIPDVNGLITGQFVFTGCPDLVNQVVNAINGGCDIVGGADGLTAAILLSFTTAPFVITASDPIGGTIDFTFDTNLPCPATIDPLCCPDWDTEMQAGLSLFQEAGLLFPLPSTRTIDSIYCGIFIPITQTTTQNALLVTLCDPVLDVNITEPADSWGQTLVTSATSPWLSPADLTSLAVVAMTTGTTVSVNGGPAIPYRAGQSAEWGQDGANVPVKAAGYVSVTALPGSEVFVTWQVRP